jgi:protein SCO1/2
MNARRLKDLMRLAKPLTLIAGTVLVVAACSGEDVTPQPNTAATAEPTLAAEPTVVATTEPTPVIDPTLAPTLEPTAAPRPEPTAAPSADATPETAALVPAAIGDPQPAPELAGLVNADGSTFDLADYEGTNTLLFFGYTHCPDVCPTTIGEIFGVFKEAPETQAVFVSVDPERDTPEFLAEWTAYFPDNFNAVTGSPGAIRRAADNYGVKYARVETTSTAGYAMSHTADLWLIDENGQMLLTYPFGTPAAAIVEDLTKLNAG